MPVGKPGYSGSKATGLFCYDRETAYEVERGPVGGILRLLNLSHSLYPPNQIGNYVVKHKGSRVLECKAQGLLFYIS